MLYVLLTWYEDLRESDDFGALCSSFTNDADGLLDTTLKVKPCSVTTHCQLYFD